VQRVYSAMACKPGMQFILAQVPNLAGRAVEGLLWEKFCFHPMHCGALSARYRRVTSAKHGNRGSAGGLDQGPREENRRTGCSMIGS
jgi:hypothetical protein